MVKEGDTERVRIRSADDIVPAARALRAIAETIADWRIAIVPNVARRHPMLDHHGVALAATIFGWDGKDGGWNGTPRRTLDSPVHTACRYTSEPFWCNAAGFHARRTNPLLDGIDVTGFEQRSLIRAALVVPLHLPFGTIGAVAFIPRDRAKTDLSEEFSQHGDALALCAYIFVSSYNQVMASRDQAAAVRSLSHREVECLKWAALGKTDDEIGLIISRSRSTIRFHIANAATKLNTINRSETVLRASQLGYIGRLT